MAERFPRLARLSKGSEFSAVFANRQVARSERLSVFAKTGPAVGRLGLAVSRKTAPRAVDRNYMKRVIRDVFRHHATAFAGLDIVVTPRRIFARGEAAAIEADLLALVVPLGRKCRDSFRA